MKYGKSLAKIFAHRSNNDAHVAVALVAGLAAGAILSILFAPDSGSNIRRGISDQAKGLGDGLKDKYTSLRDKLMGEEEEAQRETAEVPHFAHNAPKKRKSDIKDLIHEAHVGDQQTDQPVS